MTLSLIPIPILPTPPSKSDPTNFASRADSFLDSLPSFVTNTNNTIATLNQITSGLDQTSPIAAYNAGTTYNFPTVVAGSDGMSYRCIGVNITGVNPVSDNGTSWVAVGGGGGLKWSIETADKTTIKGKAYLMDTSIAVKTVTLHASPVVGDTVAVGDLKGSFNSYSCTILSNSMRIHGTVQDLTLDVKNQRVTLVYTGATDGWVITELEPNNSQFEYMPYAVMHVREEQTSGTAGGASIAGTQTRILNKVAKNDIVGASLAGNQISLPAGDYWIELRAPWFGNVSLQKVRLYNVTNASYMLDGEGGDGNTAGTSGGVLTCNGSVTLSVSSVLELRHFTTSVISNGLGKAASQGTEVYAEAIITKIGGNYAPRLITTDARLQMVAGLDYTGNILGFDITRKDNTTVTVGKGACKDSTGMVDLYLTNNTDCTLLTGANTQSQLFVCKLVSNGNITVKAYASEAAAAADVGVISAFRWIGPWSNDGSGIASNWIIKDGELRLLTPFVYSASLSATTWTLINVSTYFPVSRISKLEVGFYRAYGAASNVVLSIDGSTDWKYSGAYVEAAEFSVPVVFFYRVYSAAVGCKFLSFILRR